MEFKDKHSFSKQIAETIGLESAIIINFINENQIEEDLSSDVLKRLLQKEFQFLDKKDIDASLALIKKFDLVKPIEKSKYQVKSPSKSIKKKNKINKNWYPSKDVIEVLDLGNIPIKFSEKKLSEFIIFWSEKEQERDNWSTLFIDFIRREWAKESNSTKGLPFCISKDWKPDNDVFDILEFSDISKKTASKYLKEFILYWSENGSAFTTWNSKFIEHVKRRHLVTQVAKNEKNKEHYEPGEYTKDFSSRKSDKSWAEELNFE